MSFLWDQIEQREKAQKATEKALKEFLKTQNEQDKMRKVEQKQAELNEARKLFGQPPVKVADKIKSNERPVIDNNSKMAGITSSISNVSINPMPNTASLTQNQSLQSATTTNTNNNSQVLLSNFSHFPPAASPSTFSSLPSLSATSSISPLITPATNSITPLQSTFTTVPHNNQNHYDEILTKLRFTEEQLQQERRTRLQLETEIQGGKSLLAALTARVEKLSEIVLTDGHSIRETTKRVVESDERSRQSTHQLSLRLENDLARIQQTLAEVLSKQRVDDSYKQEQEEKNRMLLTELNGLKFKLESTEMKANQFGTDFASRMREWESELSNTSQAVRAIREHDQAISSLSTTVDSATDSMSRKVDSLLLDLRMRLETESRARAQFEQTTRDMYAEVRKAQQASDRDTIEKIESVKKSILFAVERDKRETEGAITTLAEHFRKEKQSLQDSISQLLEKQTIQKLELDKSLESERQSVRTSATRLESAMEDGFKIVHQAISRRADDVAKIHEVLKSQVVQTAKSLQDSIYLAEKSFEQRLASLEEVLRAEIKARMDTDAGVESLAKEVGLKLERYDKNLLNFKEADLKQMQELQKSNMDEISSFKESINRAQSNLLAHIEEQLTPFYVTIKDLDKVIHDSQQRVTELESKFESSQREKHSSATLEAHVNNQLESMQYTQQQVAQKYQELQNLLKSSKNELEEKIQLKATQLDSTLEAFKQELALRVRQDDLDAAETRVQLAVNNVHKISDYLQSELGSIKEDLSQALPRSDFLAMESKTKTNIEEQGQTLSQMNISLNNITSQISEFSTRKQFVDLETRTRKSMDRWQTKEQEIQQALHNLRTELASKCSRESQIDLEKTFSARVDEQHNQLVDLDKSLKEVRQTLIQKTNRKEVEESLKTLASTLKDWNDASWKETSTLLNTLEDSLRQELGQEIGKISAALQPNIDTMLQIVSELDESIQKYRQEMMDQTNQQKEGLVQFSTAHGDLLEETKRQLQEQLDNISQKVEDVLPRKLTQLESHADAIKAEIVKQFEAKHILLSRSLTDTRRHMDARLNEMDLDALRSEYTTALAKLSSKLDTEMAALSHLRSRMQKTEEDALSRIDGAVAGIEYRIQELDQDLRQIESGQTKLVQESAELREMLNPKSVDWCVKAIRGIHHTIDKEVESRLTRQAQEITELRNDMDSFVTDREIERSIGIHLAPIKSHVDRIKLEVQELKNRNADKRLAMNSHLQANISDNYNNTDTFTSRFEPTRGGSPVVPSTFYKPAHVPYSERNNTKSSVPRTASAVSMGQQVNRNGESDQELKRSGIDMSAEQQSDEVAQALASQEHLPIVGRPSVTSEVPIEY